jgi:LacI family transcriptional regulator
LRELGVAVPREIAVTGFDDIPIAQYTSPPLTSVRVPILDLGERATELLVGQLASQRRRRRVCETLPTTLVVRQSCAGDARISLTR